jgi:hypothetical protein
MDPISAVLDMGGKLIDQLFPDQTDRDAARLRLLELQQSGELAQLAARSGIVKTGASSNGFMASSWRPIVMLVFTALIVARWFGWAAPGLSEHEALKLWDIVHLGLGGYVIGRSAEKILPGLVSVIKSK